MIFKVNKYTKNNFLQFKKFNGYPVFIHMEIQIFEINNYLENLHR